MSSPSIKQPRIARSYQTITDYLFSAGGAFFLGVGIIVVLNLIWMGFPSLTSNGTNFFGGQIKAKDNFSAYLLRITLSSVLAIMFMSLYAIHIRKLRRDRAMIVLNHLCAAVEMRLPIAGYLESVALNEDGNLCKRLTDLAGLVKMGIPLGTALYSSNGELDLRVPSMIDAAERTGQLETILKKLSQKPANRDDSAFGAATVAYLAITMTFMSVVIGMVLIFVIPKFMEIFNDFNVQLPHSTRMLLEYPVELMLLLAIPLFLFILVMLANLSRRIISSRQELRWYAGIIDWMRWKTPIIRTVYQNQAYADFCNIVAGAIESGYTISDALQASNRVDVNWIFRRQIVNTLASHLNGTDISIAASQNRLPDLISSMFKTPERDRLAEALRFSGRTYESRLSRSLLLIQSAAPILVTFFIATIVGFVAVSLFEPIARLMMETSPYRLRL